MACSVSGGSSFSEALFYALRRLEMTQITVREEQRSSMRAVYDGSDVFVWLPTGYGKSLCYQALPFLMDYKKGLVDSGKSCGVLVVSPLIALMVDQVESLRSKGIKSSIITSGEGVSKELLATIDNLSSDSLLFCTPEALVRSKWRSYIQVPRVSERIVAYVVDEAHCVSKW